VYDRPATFGPHVIRLCPADHTRARVLSYNLDIQPTPRTHWQQDPWANRIVRATFDEVDPVRRLDIVVDAAFDLHPVNPFDFFLEESFRELPAQYDPALIRELAPFLRPPELGPRVRAFAEAHPPRGYLVDYLVDLNRSVARTVRYIIRDEPGIWSSEETLTMGSGSCRDSAVLLVDVLRHHGLAARFVSGYLIQLTDEGNIPDEAKGVDRDVVDLHAWAEVYVPGAGWVGLDGTSGLLVGEGHVPLAGAADPMLAGPVDGTASHAADELDVDMQVVRLGHEPRPRVPYTDQTWSDMLEVGRRADRMLDEAGLQVTMGGEPTWTSRLHPTEEEWNGDALGPTKWAQGIRLTRELMHRLAPGGLLMHRFGKHYPGESLPRWVMHLLWRPDGEPIWRDLMHLDFGSGGHAAVDDGRPVPGGRGLDESARFQSAFAHRLGVDPEHWMPGYEDPWHFIQREEDLPVDVDPMTTDLSDPEDRRRLARALGRGLGTAVGHALPLGRGHDGWVVDRWTFRRSHLFLIPGDSPMGLRLPLERIGGQAFFLRAQDPSSVVGPLPEPPWVKQSLRSNEPPPRAHRLSNPAESVRTALCVEPRAGVIHVFLPPVPSTDDFLELVTAVEDAAADSGVPVSLEGYPPPSDPRLRSCLVTPDPGVLEVNVPVTRTFDEYVGLMETVTEAATHAGLTSEKFQLDGRVTGSGGGHHLTLGGPTTRESPWVLRPDLLAGLLRFFQNHPSLSYLFTGLFVGPTSQAPRIEEARHDALYELEIALARLESVAPSQTPPWLTDRLLCNLLVDVSGNTHRTEICIDKLYDPGHASGRQGLLEFRAFEMPPHERMSVAQMLIVRSIVARLSRAPYRRPLIRWGSQLHDRFMLPHFLWADFQDVMRELREVGLPVAEDHYRPFWEFRCPRVGRHEVENVALELRSALEPWPVLGEQGTAGGTVRYVDSSVERIEVKVRGVDDERHVVTVNGWELPLRPTGVATERVAGVRFKAWQPPHGLQPTVPVHHPLRIDVVDTWAQRSLGAVTYHVWHPEGRAFDEPPLTAFEAAARRAQRFTTRGHAPYPAVVRPAPIHPEQPFTLDLRRLHEDGPAR
jgi:uncharacterized protein (DUF2126 family)/transglutaminase-like putative cysteine protease